MSKICWSCKEEKPLEDFGNNRRKKDGKQGYCKICSREKDKNHYQSSAHRRTSIRNDASLRTNRARQYILNHLRQNPCIDCGERDVVVLEFDHIEKKQYNISRMMYLGCTIKNIENEIKKCEVRCANCHKRKTANQFGWWKQLLDKHMR